jgi:Rad52/22 family double-strand break repair protein
MSADVERLTEALALPFDPSLVKFKPAVVQGNRALALAYVDARAVQERLDEVLGVENWQDEYEHLPDGSVVCRLRLRLGDEWITKVDVGSPSEQPDEHDRVKAAFSDALKRAAVKFGVGRYLYRLPSTWCDYDPQKRQFKQLPPLPSPKQPKGSKVIKALPAADSKLPSDGAELVRRLTDYEAKLAAQGVCQVGELLQHLAKAGKKAGYGDDFATWGQDAISWAAKEVRAFEKASRSKASAKKVA